MLLDSDNMQDSGNFRTTVQLGNFNIEQMTTWEKQIFILRQLRELETIIHPILTNDFHEKYLSKTLTEKEISLCIELLKKKNFINIPQPDAKSMSSYISITHEGMEEIEKWEDSEKEKKWQREIKEQQTTTNKNIYYLTIILAIGAGIASVYYLIEIAKNFCHCP